MRHQHRRSSDLATPRLLRARALHAKAGGLEYGGADSINAARGRVAYPAHVSAFAARPRKALACAIVRVAPRGKPRDPGRGTQVEDRPGRAGLEERELHNDLVVHQAVAVQEKPPAPIGQFRAGGREFLGAIPDAYLAGTAKSRCHWRAVAKRRPQQVVLVLGHRGCRRLAVLEDLLEQRLLLEVIDQAHRGGHVLRFHATPEVALVRVDAAPPRLLPERLHKVARMPSR